jgi:hypothetical protein
MRYCALFAIMLLSCLLSAACSEEDEPRPYGMSQQKKNFADAHFNVSQLAAAYDFQSAWSGGLEYFDVASYEELPLCVSHDEDPVEYYRNIGRWNQFVFGWDDFMDPHIIQPGLPVGDIRNLDIPGVSARRDTYREME